MHASDNNTKHKKRRRCPVAATSKGEEAHDNAWKPSERLFSMNAKTTLCCIVYLLLLATSTFAGEVYLSAPDGAIRCGSFDAAQQQVADLFQSVQAEDASGNDLTDAIRVTRITWADARGRYEYVDLKDASKKSGRFAAGEYDYTLAKTRKLFHVYFIFKPGGYEISYEVLDKEGHPIDSYAAKATQLILVDDDCAGPLGCLSRDAMAGCRSSHIPASASGLKRLMGDWLLLGLAALVAACQSRRGL